MAVAMTTRAFSRDQSRHGPGGVGPARRGHPDSAGSVVRARLRTGVAERVHHRQTEQSAGQQDPPGGPPGRQRLLPVHRFTLARDPESTVDRLITSHLLFPVAAYPWG